MSTAVTETSSHASSQSARSRSGQTSQSAPGDGFSGLVDSNLTAANSNGNGNGNDAPQQPDRPRPSQREASADSEGRQRTGVQRRPQGKPESTRQASDEPAAKDANPADTDKGTTDATTTLEAQVVVAAGTVNTKVNPDQVDAPADGDTQDAQPASADAATPAVAATGVVAVAVAVQIDLAASTAVPVIQPSDAIVVSNPPATIVAAPAGTAASALARVALDTADTQAPATTPSTGETSTPAQAETGAQTATATTAETAAATALAQANTGTTDATAETPAETPVTVETAAPQAQLTAKAQAELSATAKGDAAKAADQPQVEQVVASAAPKPAPISKRDEVKAAPEKPAVQKPETTTERRVEARTSSEDQPNRTPDAEARPAQRAPHEQTATAPAHTQAAASEPQQPTGFGLSQTTTLQTANAAVQAAQLTAVPVAANVQVPVGGLAVEIAANAQIGRSRFEIRLDPPELGRIDVRLDVDQKGQVTSHLIVEKSSTLEMLRRDAPQLERALQDAGLKTSDSGLQFSLRDQQQQTGRNDDQGSGRNAQRLMVTDEETVVAETAGRSYGRMASLRGGIDIRV